MGGRHAGCLRIAAVDGAPHAAHERRDLLAGSELSVRIGPHRADALDAADLGDVAPQALAEVDLRVVEPERGDVDHHMAGLRLRIGKVREDQLLRPAILLDDDGSHDASPWFEMAASLAGPFSIEIMKFR